MSKHERKIVLNIKGRDWTFRLMTDRNFDKLHNSNENPEDNNNAAMTMPASYEIHFRKSDWCLKDIRHEIGHLLYSTSLVNSAKMQPDQVEETFCEIIGEHCSEIILWSDLVAERFFRENI
jgi:hypothetical protein